MSDIAIRVTGLSKRYRIGLQKARYRTLRESISESFSRIGRKSKEEKSFFWALKDIDFEVIKGESLGIIGRNGAGKSTLLKILSRITKPTKGRAVLDGRVGSLLEVGTGFHPELTGRENIYLNGAILGMRRAEIERKFDEIVAFSEIEQFLETPVKRYSSGMYVRLAFAVAANMEPEILMVDEVLAVGDAEFQKKCLGKMDDVVKTGRTVLFVSHNMTSIKSLMKKVLWLEHGAVKEINDSQETVNNYLKSTVSDNRSIFFEKEGIYTFNDETVPERRNKLISEVKICSQGENTNKILMGNDVDFEIKLANMKKFPGFYIKLIINNNDNMQVTAISSHMTGDFFAVKDDKPFRAKLKIRKIPLIPGTYPVDIQITQAGDAFLDKIENAFSIEILENDIYNSGVRMTSKQGIFFLDGTWKFYET